MSSRSAGRGAGTGVSRRRLRKLEPGGDSFALGLGQNGPGRDRDAHGGSRGESRELQQCRERLRRLSSELLRVEERQRARLSLDLHDGLSQILVLTKIKLGALRKSADPDRATPIAEIEHLIDQAHRSVRSITFELHPSTLDELGLEAAARWLAEHLGARYGVAIRVEAACTAEPLDLEHRTILLRSLRELLINAAKHAHATEIVLRLGRTASAVELAVLDDGIGMPDGAARSPGFGLASIRECLAPIGGSLHIESLPERGTKVFLRAPHTRDAIRHPGPTP